MMGMDFDFELPEGVWCEVEDAEKGIFVLGMDESIKQTTGAFIELKCPEIGHVFEEEMPVIQIVGTDADVDVMIPKRVEVLEVNQDIVDLQNINERDWVLRLQIL
jgi:glycine cleavage system H lipoate-binding protein